MVEAEATMPEDTPQPPPPRVPSEPATAPAEPPIPFNIGEEFGTARKNLPPTKILLLTVAGIALITAVVGFVQKPRQTANGGIDQVAMVELPGQNQVMVAIGLSIHNYGKNPYVVQDVGAVLQANNSSYPDQAASAVDVARYFEAFPALKEHAYDPLKMGTSVAPGGDLKATIVVTFPVAANTFSNRKSLTVTVSPAEQPIPLVLTK
jgi:hypothetical protein